MSPVGIPNHSQVEILRTALQMGLIHIRDAAHSDSSPDQNVEGTGTVTRI